MNPFLEACGATNPWRLIVESNGAPVPALTPFETPYLIVGQDQAADLCLAHKDVSERHAFLQWVAGRLHVIDLGSRTGVLYEGRRQRVGWLDTGQSVRIGPYRLALPEHETVDASDDPRALPALSLEMKLRGIRALNARAEGPLVVLGSAADCEVRLLDPAVTSYHCAIINSPHGSWIVDLLGTGGITLNGESTRSAPLSEGDVIVVGRSTIRIASVEWLESRKDAAPARSCEPAPEPVGTREVPRVMAVSQAATAQTASQSLDPQPDYAVPPAAVVHHPAHAHVPPLASRFEPEPPLPATDEPEPTSEAVAEPRRHGFFAGWRRGPVNVPNRAPGTPIPQPMGATELAPARGPELTPGTPVWEATALSAASWDDPAPTGSGWSAPPSTSFESTFASGPEGAERRGSCRYPIAGRVAYISWWEASEPHRDGRFGAVGRGPVDPGTGDGAGAENRSLTVSLVDVSQAGLAVLSPVAPPRGEHVWFRLDEGATLDWVELIAVGHSSAGNGQQLVRFAFRETCPYDLFKALVFAGGLSRR